MRNQNVTTAGTGRVQALVRGRSLLAAAIEAGRPVTRLGILRTSCNPDATAYFEAMAEARRKAFSKSFLVGASNAKPTLPDQPGSGHLKNEN